MKIISVYTLFLCMLLCVCGCAHKTEEPVVASVNGQPIYLKDFQRELSIRVRQNPSLELDKETLLSLADTLIKRQIIIQEATKKHMAEEPSFRDTIKSFWEQTLIRDFINYKTSEFNDYTFVTDKEIEDYYNGLKANNTDLPELASVYDQVREMVEQKKKMQAMEEWLDEKKRASNITLNKKIIFNKLKEPRP